jgi:hypothetical protein
LDFVALIKAYHPYPSVISHTEIDYRIAVIKQGSHPASSGASVLSAFPSIVLAIDDASFPDVSSILIALFGNLLGQGGRVHPTPHTSIEGFEVTNRTS